MIIECISVTLAAERMAARSAASRAAAAFALAAAAAAAADSAAAAAALALDALARFSSPRLCSCSRHRPHPHIMAYSDRLVALQTMQASQEDEETTRMIQNECIVRAPQA